MIRSKVLAAALFGLGLIGLSATPAAAQFDTGSPILGSLADGGWYVSAAGQYAEVEDADVSANIGGLVIPSGIFELDADPGYGALGAVGWHTRMGWRAEGEFSWLEFDTGNLFVPVTNTVLVIPEGDVRILSGMFNVLYEASLLPWLHPYVGGGLGLADVDVELGGDDDSDTVFAFQVIVGSAFDITDNLSLTADYRYFDTDDPTFSGVEVDLAAHKVTAGVRLSTN